MSCCWAIVFGRSVRSAHAGRPAITPADPRQPRITANTQGVSTGPPVAGGWLDHVTVTHSLPGRVLTSPSLWCQILCTRPGSAVARLTTEVKGDRFGVRGRTAQGVLP